MAKPEYAGPEWQRIRKVVLRRDNHLCQIRSPHCRTVANAVDHIVAISRGGARLDLANLQAACVSCNTWKRNQDRRRDRLGRFEPGSPEPHSGWVTGPDVDPKGSTWFMY